MRDVRRPRLRSLLVAVATATVLAGSLASGPVPAAAEEPAAPATPSTTTPTPAGETPTGSVATGAAPAAGTPGAGVPAGGAAVPGVPDVPVTEPTDAPVTEAPGAAAPAEPGHDAPAVGDVVVGELVQGYADPGPATEGAHAEEEHEEHTEHQDGGLLSWVRDDTGAAVRVPTGEVEDVEVGATLEVTVGGMVQDEATEAGLEPARDLLTAEVVAPAQGPVASPTTAPVNHPVTVVMLQPAGVPRDSTTLAQVTAAVNTSVGDFWEEQSGGAVRFGVVAGFDWTATTATCAEPMEMWRAAAARAGWTEGARKHLLVYVPSGSPGCSYGLGTVGGSLDDGGLAYVEAAATSVIAHEFGHNLGLGHSSAVQCDGAIEGGTCRRVPYGDYYDVMGISWDEVGSLVAPQADLLGVLAAGDQAAVAATDPGGSFTLTPYGSGGGLRALRLTGLDGSVYWLEYRTAVGQDTWLGSSANWTGIRPGLLLRRETSGGDTSLLLDASPVPAGSWDADLTQPFDWSQPTHLVGAGSFVLTLRATAAGVVVDVTTDSPIRRAHEGAGGDAGPLGPALADPICGRPSGGCSQEFRGGTISWSAATGAQVVTGTVRTRWVALGREAGLLGYPTEGTRCGLTDGGCGQDFQKGSLYGTTAGGVRVMTGAVRDWWVSRRLVDPLGYPTVDVFCGLPRGGCGQHFQRGSVYWSPQTGAASVTGLVRDRWAALGWEAGPLGYPTSSTVCGLARGGCRGSFQGGHLAGTAATGVRVVELGGVHTAWGSQGREAGALGYPTTDTFCGLPQRGCAQHFQGGSVYRSPATGARIVTGPVRKRWAAMGWELSRLGYPVSDTVCGLVAAGCAQHFQGGSLYSTGTVPARFVAGAIRDRWVAAGAQNGALGYPTTDEFCGLRGGGCAQHFQRGSIYWTGSTGARVLSGALRDRWAATGWELSRLGYPVSDTICGLADSGCYQLFQGGSLYSSASTPARTVGGAIRDRWGAAGSERGTVGYPVTDEFCGLRGGGCAQHFQRGSVYWSPATGARIVTGAVRDRWAALGWELSGLGYPVTGTTCGLVDSGCAQHFQFGSLYGSASTRVRLVNGVIRDRWLATGGERGTLGYPTTDPSCGASGVCQQTFQQGRIRWSAATGAVVLPPS